MTQYELNLRDYWRVIEKRYPVLAVIFLMVLIPTIIYTNTQKPLYQASASVQWIERQTFASLLVDLVNVNISTGDPLVTQSRIITSLPILEKVVVGLGLVSEQASPDEIKQQAAAIRGAVSTDMVPHTSIINIIVTHGNPQLAAKIANKVAEVYIAENLREKSKQSRSVREFIEKQLQDVSVKLKASEETLVKFKETEVPSGVALPLQGRLQALYAEHQNLIQKYTDGHPNVKNIEEQIEQIKSQLKTLPQKELEYSRLDREVEINARLYNTFKDKLEAARIAEAEKVEDASLVEPAPPLASPIGANKSLNYFMGALIGLMLGLAVMFLLEQLDTSIGTIEDVESYLKIPALGIIPYLRTKDEKATGLIQRLWPKKLKGKERILRLRNQLVIYYPSASTIFESYRILRTNIQSEVFKEKIQGKILLFSSSGPEEGKSITVSNLAIVMAQGGLRTLLIDGDMRRSTIHKMFGMKNEPGLSNILKGTVEFKDAIRTFTDILISDNIWFNEALKIPGLDNLNILVSGSLSSGVTAELLASPEMAALLEKLRAKYDIILIDSPPVLAVTDATVIASKTDGVILVYRVGKTSRALLARTKTQLVETGAQVKGVILNNISPQMEMHYGYQYYYKYYGKYYTQPDREKAKEKKEQA